MSDGFEEPTDPAPTSPGTRGSTLKGFLLGMGLDGLAAIVLFAIGNSGRRGEWAMIALLLMGVAHVLWLGPLAVGLLLKGRRRTAGGVAIVMALGLLLTGGCIGLMSFASFH